MEVDYRRRKEAPAPGPLLIKNRDGNRSVGFSTEAAAEWQRFRCRCLILSFLSPNKIKIRCVGIFVLFQDLFEEALHSSIVPLLLPPLVFEF